MISACIISAVDHTHCSSITGAWHEVSGPDAQPCQGQLHDHFLLHLLFSHLITRLSLFSEYRAVCNSTDVLSVNWRSQNPAHSSRLQNWHRHADRKASLQHWVMAKSLKGSFLESLCYVKELCNIIIIIILLLLCAMSKWFGVLQIFLKALVHSLCLVLSH